MSWLRRHMDEFVVPTIRTLVRKGGRELTMKDVKPFDGRVRPASNCKYEEAGLLFSVVSSMLPKSSKEKEKLLAMCRTLDGNDLTGCRTQELGARFDVPPGDVMHSIIWNSLRKLRKLIRRHGAVLVLPGRDVWAWEVIARQRRLISIYDSRVSRTIADHHPTLRKVIGEWGVPDMDGTLVFDTGFAGSIHRNICQATQKKPKIMLLSADEGLRDRQVFPGHTGSRSKALAIEYFPKYLQRATIQDNEVYQAISSIEEFIKTALLTIWLWYHVSPKHIESAKPKRASGPVFLKGGGNLQFSNIGMVSTTNPFYITGASGTAVSNFSITANVPMWNSSAATTIPNINIVQTVPGTFAYQIPITGDQQAGILAGKVAANPGLMTQQMAQQINDVANMMGQDVVKEVVQAKLEDDALKSKMLTGPPLDPKDDVFVPTTPAFIDPNTFALKQKGHILKPTGIKIPVVIDDSGHAVAF